MNSFLEREKWYLFCARPSCGGAIFKSTSRHSTRRHACVRPLLDSFRALSLDQPPLWKFLLGNVYSCHPHLVHVLCHLRPSWRSDRLFLQPIFRTLHERNQGSCCNDPGFWLHISSLHSPTCSWHQKGQSLHVLSVDDLRRHRNPAHDRHRPLVHWTLLQESWIGASCNHLVVHRRRSCLLLHVCGITLSDCEGPPGAQVWDPVPVIACVAFSYSSVQICRLPLTESCAAVLVHLHTCSLPWAGMNTLW